MSSVGGDEKGTDDDVEKGYPVIEQPEKGRLVEPSEPSEPSAPALHDMPPSYQSAGDIADAEPVIAHAVPYHMGEPAGEVRWPTPLFGCFENCVPSLCMACFCCCLPITRVRVNANIRGPSIQGFPGSQWYPNLFFFALLFLLDYSSGGSHWFPLASLSIIGLIRTYCVAVTRHEYRKTRRITENCCFCQNTMWDDVCSAFWCSPCVIAQLDRSEFQWAEGCGPSCDNCFEAFRNPRAADYLDI